MRIAFLLVLSLFLLVVTAEAQTELGVYRFGAAFDQEKPLVDNLDLRLENLRGGGLSIGHSFSRHLALRADVSYIDADAKFRISGEDLSSAGTLRILPVAATVELHSGSDRRIDFFAGAGGAYVFTRDLQGGALEEIGERIEIGRELAPVATAGIVVRAAGHSFLVLDARYMPLEFDDVRIADRTANLEYDPVVISLGYRFRF